MLYLYPYKTNSASAKALREGLSQALGYHVKMVLPEGKFKPKRTDKVINWGFSQIPRWEWSEQNDLNSPWSVFKGANKLNSFWAFQNEDVKTPRFTIEREEAQEWLNQGSKIVVRHTLTQHSGLGIELVDSGQLPVAPLYVEYKKKRDEFRVHVFKGEVIDTQQKKKRTQANRPDTFNTAIRNHSNGWVYCRNNIEPDIFRDALAILAVKAIGLDFGAVDIIYNAHEQQNYVLEVNSAPGLEGETLNKYIEAILK